MEGYIKYYRSILKWEWYKNIPVRTLFEHCLLKANHTDKKWQGIIIKKGSFVTSRGKLAQETGLTIQQVRTALSKLKSTSEITSQTTSEYSIITVNNWEKYQPDNQQINQQSTSNQPAINQQVTTTNNGENEENIKEEEVVVVVDELKKNVSLENWYGEYCNVHLDNVQLGKLKSLILNDEFLFSLIDALSENIAIGKISAYDETKPWAHFVLIKRYWQYRKTHPDKFKSEKPTAKLGKTTAQIVEEARERMKERDTG